MFTKKFRLALVVLLVVATPTVNADDVLFRGLDSGQSYSIQKVGGKWQLAKIDEVVEGVGGVNPVNPPVVDGEDTLANWVKKSIARIPAHQLKEETEIGLAAGYQGLAKHWADGQITDVNVLLAERKKIHDMLTGALGVSEHWKAFDDSLVQELNRRQIAPAELAGALEEVSEGLTAGKAINPLVLKAGIKLVLALLSKNPVAISAAIGELVVALLGNIGS